MFEHASRDIDSHDLRRVGAHPDHWYPVAWSHELKPGRIIATRFARQPIALVRPFGKPVFALEDRCAHRQIPLSIGEVTGCKVRCSYHGWTYDAAGQCIDVPYSGHFKQPNGVRSYPCEEVEGLIFIWPGEISEVKPLGTVGVAGSKAFKTRRFGRVVRCHYTFMHENLMDMNHSFYIGGRWGRYPLD